MKKLSISLAVATILTATGLSAEESKTNTDLSEISPWLKRMKINGQFKLWYQTMDHGGVDGDKGLFRYDKNNANEWGNIEASLSLSGQVNDHLKHKMTLMTVSTLGLDGHVVAKETSRPSVFGSSNGSNPQPFWVHEAFLDYVFTKNTDVKFGRMELDTPFAFTEKWNAASNSFEALVATNTDLEDTILVGAWVAKGNGATSNLAYAPQVFGAESKYNNFMGYVDGDGNTISSGGALAVGAINKTVLPVQVWAYHVPEVAQAFWGQVDGKIENVGPLEEASFQLVAARIGLKDDVQEYVKANLGDTKDTSGVALKVASKLKNYTFFGAFSAIGEGNLPLANTATNFKKTKIPTASIFSDGMVAAQPDTTAWKIGGTANFEDIGKLMVSYAGYSVGQNENYVNPNKKLGGPASMGHIAQNILKEDIELNEFDMKFTTKVADVNLDLMYIYVSKTYVPGGDNYGTYDDSIFRMVGNLKF